MEYTEYKKELLKDQKAVDAMANGDLSVCTMIDELYILGYKIEKFDVTQSYLQSKPTFKVGDNVIYRGVINAIITEELEHNFFKIKDIEGEIMKAYTNSLELQ